ncbi:MAG TPA: hypothetical protein VLG16_04815 [Candidatus Saccharimonadales bacterium]|nr:hypothetical protein [Candidatus Saccharimonadales bacterium]
MIGRLSNKGFSAVETMIILLVIGGIIFGGWYVWTRHHTKETPRDISKVQSKSETYAGDTATNPYAGWKTAVSSRAGFTVKYPESWSYSQSIGTKDNIEHLIISSPKFRVTIDSYRGKDPAGGGQSATICPDCIQTLNSKNFNAGRLGIIELKTIRYTLDNGEGNALVLENSSSSYYIPSVNDTSVTTSFRAISMLNSQQAYQTETPTQFISNSDYTTAKEILQSINY